MSSSCTIVVPCYNEASRLDADAFVTFATSNDLDLLFVDDGSTDDTPRLLASVTQTAPARIRSMRLDRNSGKAEAVRQGLIAASRSGTQYVGFWDADLATPLAEIPAFMAILDTRPEIDMVFGARVALLGRSIRRNLARHYAGRVFATAASVILRLGIYDTQCGAKIFRVTETFVRTLERPFIGGWIFDVEMIAREIGARRARRLPPVKSAIYEYPLNQWHDIAGSKINAIDWVRVARNLARIFFRYSARGFPDA